MRPKSHRTDMLSILYQAMAIREDIIVAPTGLSYGMVHGGQTMSIIILKVGLSSPINLGMNLGRLVKLSRIKYYQRSGGSMAILVCSRQS